MTEAQKTALAALEPAAAKLGLEKPTVDSGDFFLLSIAISLKRIADELAGTPSTTGIVGAVYDALAQARQS